MFKQFFTRLVTPVINAIAVAILKSDTAKEWMAQAIADRVSVKAVAHRLDYGRLQDELDTNDLYTYVAKHCGVSASDIAEHLDSEDIAQHVEIDYYEVAGRMEASEVAAHLDLTDVARELEIDYYEVAGRMEASEVAAHLDLTDVARELEIDVDDVTVDYESLAKALLRELAKPKAEVRSSNS